MFGFFVLFRAFRVILVAFFRRLLGLLLPCAFVELGIQTHQFFHGPSFPQVVLGSVRVQLLVQLRFGGLQHVHLLLYLVQVGVDREDVDVLQLLV